MSKKKLAKLVFVIFVWFAISVYMHEVYHRNIAEYFGVKTKVHYYVIYGYTEYDKLPEDKYVAALIHHAQSMLDIVTYAVYMLAFLALLIIVWLESEAERSEEGTASDESRRI